MRFYRRSATRHFKKIGLAMQSRTTRNIKDSLAPVIVLTFFLFSTGSWAASLSDLVAQRLSFMKDVAAYKWQYKLPIENRAREAVVLESAVAQGLRFGLMATSSRAFFSVQIEAAKEVQRYWFDQWRQNPDRVPRHTTDLSAVIRPMLLVLGENISQSLAYRSISLRGLQIEGLSPTTVIALDEAARSVTRSPDQLAQIRDSGLLRVGTTGDYAPFSLREGATSPHGVDIDLAQNLAQSLGVDIVWIDTSWPTLMQDLHEGRYDIGMSGISINDQRRNTAFFSLPYHSGGKTAISRCADTDSFNSLADIDQPSTIVVVNPGGTNQKFVAANIQSATVRVHADNRTIFQELVEHRADVMITDLIEVRLQSGKNPSLCPALGGKTFTQTAKGFLLPQDNTWRAYVDRWILTQDTQRLIAERFSVHVP
jgi:cyclohexadienyl dehydratase